MSVSVSSAFRAGLWCGAGAVGLSCLIWPSNDLTGPKEISSMVMFVTAMGEICHQVAMRRETRPRGPQTKNPSPSPERGIK